MAWPVYGNPTSPETSSSASFTRPWSLFDCMAEPSLDLSAFSHTRLQEHACHVHVVCQALSAPVIFRWANGGEGGLMLEHVDNVPQVLVWTRCQCGPGGRGEQVSEWNRCQHEPGVSVDQVSVWTRCQNGTGVSVDQVSEWNMCRVDQVSVPCQCRSLGTWTRWRLCSP